MNDIRLTKEMKFMLLQLMAFGDTPKRMASQIYNEFVCYNVGKANPKLLKDTIRLLKHCDYYWDGSYVEEFTAELKKLLPNMQGDLRACLEVTV